MTPRTDVYVHDLTFALGSLSSTVEEAEREGRTLSSAALLRESGFRRHFRAADDESVLDLALKAIDPIRAGLSDLDVILWATCIPENASLQGRESFAEHRDVKPLMDYPASRLQAALGLPRAACLGVTQQACTSMIGSLRLARALLLSEPDTSRALCLTSDRFPEGAVYEQAFALISDGAAACVVSCEEKGFRLLSTHHITNGAAVQASDEETASVYFTYTHRLIHELLAKARLPLDEVAWVVPQNMNVKAWQILSRLLRMDPERVFMEPLPEVGHCISGDNLINLKRLDDSGRLAPGDKVLCVMAGYGLNWQAALLEKVAS